MLKVNDLTEMMSNVNDMELSAEEIEHIMAQICFSAFYSGLASKEDVDKACERMDIANALDEYWEI